MRLHSFFLQRNEKSVITMHLNILSERQDLKMNDKQAHFHDHNYILECLHKHKIIIRVDKLVNESSKEYCPLQSV